MAIISEKLTITGRTFVKTYSNAHRYVVRDSIEYIDATDPEEFGRQYTEGRVIDGEVDPDEATAEDYEAALNRLGVTT